MLQEIEITQLPRHSKRYKADATIMPHSDQVPRKNTGIKTELGEAESKQRQSVPLKEYSNKFLRESAWKENQEREEKKKEHCRLNLLITKHKSFQKKYQKGFGKKHYVKTEPNENDYQCFRTAKSFYKHPQPEVRVKTQTLLEKNLTQLDFKTPLKPDDRELGHQTEVRKKDKQEGGREEKISTSRALEFFAKIVSKDKNELLNKIRLCNQNRFIQEKLIESSKNLEAKQISLGEKKARPIPN